MNETITLTDRQKAIISLLGRVKELSRDAIAEQLPSHFQASKATLARDLSALVEQKHLLVIGKGPSTAYCLPNHHPLLYFVDLSSYFALDPDRRSGIKMAFESSIFSQLKNLFSSDEKNYLREMNRSISDATQKLDPVLYERELERYVIELAWKSSKIEGNTYTLLETESLIKQGLQAAGRTTHETTMILNHKEAFKIILANRSDFKKPNLSLILQLHAALVKGLGVTTGLRKQAVGITGTLYRPLDNEWQLHEMMEKTLTVINSVDFPLEKALIALAMIAYIQPFADGNKRTARMLANALLLAHDHFPVSYRSIDENEYKQAVIVFYEMNNLFHLKRLFVDQYAFALKTYFVV